MLVASASFLAAVALATNTHYKLNPPDSLQPPPYDVLNVHVPMALTPAEDFDARTREHDAQMKQYALPSLFEDYH